jgi:hypothetical protein
MHPPVFLVRAAHHHPRAMSGKRAAKEDGKKADKRGTSRARKSA